MAGHPRGGRHLGQPLRTAPVARALRRLGARRLCARVPDGAAGPGHRWLLAGARRGHRGGALRHPSRQGRRDASGPMGGECRPAMRGGQLGARHPGGAPADCGLRWRRRTRGRLYPQGAGLRQLAQWHARPPALAARAQGCQAGGGEGPPRPAVRPAARLVLRPHCGRPAGGGVQGGGAEHHPPAQAKEWHTLMMPWRAGGSALVAAGLDDP
mmetsp:Transcript_5585/g.14299  ORF Transcript_5585/g.14299 Transcript_5585/m.14299 type:complete len:212 (+) Transcript_5585:569-1204(+)